MRIGALIPCRKGSKVIPGKNFKMLCGKPLWEWTFDNAIGAGVFDKIILSSDGGFNGEMPFCANVQIDNERAEELSNDQVSLDAVLNYYSLKNPDIDLWCLLQPTSPLRTAEDIKNAKKIMDNEFYESLVSVTENPCMFWVDNAICVEDRKAPIAGYHIHKRPNRQDRQDWYLENGAIYFTRKYVLDETACRLGGDVALYVMPKERSFEIDDETDWVIIEHLMGRRNGLDA